MPDRDEKGDEMADRMSRRFGSDADDADTSGESEPAQSSNTSKSAQTSETVDTENISDRPSVLMYLPEDQLRELDLRFDELNLKHKREYGEALQKNRDYYPAVIEAALNDKTLEEILLKDG